MQKLLIILCLFTLAKLIRLSRVWLLFFNVNEVDYFNYIILFAALLSFIK